MIERQNLIDFINKYGTAADKLNLAMSNDSQLRTIAQRILSEQRAKPKIVI